MNRAIHRFDRTVGLVLILLAAFLFWQTFGFQTRPYVPLNTAFWPRVILAGLTLVGTILVVRGKLTDEHPDTFSWSALIVLTAAGLFVALLPLAGFLGASIVISAGGFIWLSESRTPRAWLGAMIYGVVVSGSIYALFRTVLKVQLPMGVFG